MIRFLAMVSLCLLLKAHGQNIETDSLKNLLAKGAAGEKRVQVLEGLSYAYLSSYPDSSLDYATEGLALAKKINYRKGEALCMNALGNVYFHVGDYPASLEAYFKSLAIEESLPIRTGIPVTYYNIASVYTEQEDYTHALSYLLKAKQEDERGKDSAGILFDLYSLGSIYLRMNRNDSALYYIQQSHAMAQMLHDKNMMGAILNTFGEAYLALQDSVRAASYYRSSIPHAELVDDREVLAANYFGLAKLLQEKPHSDSSVYYARRALSIVSEGNFLKQVLEMSSFLAGLFEKRGQYDSAFHYQALSIVTKDSLFNVDKIKKVQNLKLQEQQRQQSIAITRTEFRNKIRLYLVVGASAILLIIVFLLWKNNTQRRKDYLLLKEQQARTESAYKDLKATQAQLIQSEKMASLGELTSGIAHEIQNPLNFVNNFAEVNRDLLTEMKTEIEKGNMEEIQLIVSDLEQNELKIIQHGRRAEAIVKGMLQHSRASTGQKEPADINELADEYLRIAYHGLLAKNSSFAATIHTDFDAAIQTMNIIPEDIGRVLLNLYNNAFYAAPLPPPEKIGTGSGGFKDPDDKHIPTVWVSTKKVGDKILISVSDNGPGIPPGLKDKIFQPFFTTKPTGSGTGLGLSLSYDIVKAHGGEIQVDSREGEGSTFTVELPFLP